MYVVAELNYEAKRDTEKKRHAILPHGTTCETLPTRSDTGLSDAKNFDRGALRTPCPCPAGRSSYPFAVESGETGGAKGLHLVARGRWISPDFYDDTDLARCSHSARLLYPALWQLADRCGVFEWDEAKIRKYAFGYDAMTAETFAGLMLELGRGGFIKIAEYDGKTWGYIPKMSSRQNFHKAEKEHFRDVLDGAAWCEHGADTVPIQLSLESGVLRSESGDLSLDRMLPLTETAHTEVEARSALPLPPASQETGKTGSKKAAKGVRSDAEQEAARMVRETFKASYARRYMLPLTAWGAPENSHLYHLLKTWPVAELVVMARRYFEWAHKGAIDAGHPFMNHRASFSALVHELKADIVAPERRQQSAAAEQQRKEQDVRAANADAMDRATKLLQEQANGIMGRSSGTEPALCDAESGDRVVGGRTRQADERGGASTLAETLAAARRIGPVPGA